MSHSLLKHPVDSRIVIVVGKEECLSTFQAVAFLDHDKQTTWEGGAHDSIEKAVASVLEGLNASGQDMLFGRYDPVV